MIIFINGSINSGKSTVSKILADKIGEAAVVEIDSLRGFIAWMPLAEAIPINLENAISVINNFVKNKLDVIVPYPLSQQNYEFITNGLKEYQDIIQVFTLSPKLTIALENRGSRELSPEEKERIKYHYNIGIPQPDFGVILDNSDETPEETVDKIWKIITK